MLFRSLLPDTPLVTLRDIPVEPLAMMMMLPLLGAASMVVTARDAHRFVVGLFVAIVSWFVLWYPNIAALPLPYAMVNTYQGLLPTYVYTFQWPVSTVNREVAGPGVLSSPGLLLLGAVTISALVVAYSAIEHAPASTTVVTVPWTRNEHGATAGLKTTSYAENVIALAHAHERGGSEALFANTAGHLCEGTGSNVFYVVDGELRTPSLASGCLAGITRELVVEWCGAREVDEPLAEVRERASEAFLVSTTRDVQAISRWDDRELPEPGPVTAACARTWSDREAETMDP